MGCAKDQESGDRVMGTQALERLTEDMCVTMEVWQYENRREMRRSRATHELQGFWRAWDSEVSNALVKEFGPSTLLKERLDAKVHGEDMGGGPVGDAATQLFQDNRIWGSGLLGDEGDGNGEGEGEPVDREDLVSRRRWYNPVRVAVETSSFRHEDPTNPVW